MTQPAAGPTLEELARLDEACFPARAVGRGAWAGELRAVDRLLGFRRDGRTLVAAASVRVVAGVADLHRIMVDPEPSGPGRSRTGCSRRCCGRAGRGGHGWCSRCATTTGGARLYRAFGFTVIATRRDYYGPGAHAQVMERATRPAPTGTHGPGDIT